MSQRVNGEVCPNCSKARQAGRIVSHPTQPGLYACEACGVALTRVRRNSIFGESYVFVEHERSGLTVYHNNEGARPRGSDND